MAKLKLAILDDYQGIAVQKFSHLSEQVEVHNLPDTLNGKDPQQRETLIARLKPFEIISSMRERTWLGREVVSQLPNLKLITTTGMRNAAIDLEACREHDIVVVGAKGQGLNPNPANSSDSTNEHTWALLLGLARKLAVNHVNVVEGGWQTGFAFGLKNKTLGLLGLGRLGADVGRLGKAFGMNVIAWSSSLTQEKADEQAESKGLPKGAFKAMSSKQELIENADVLSVHYVLSDRSRGIIGAEELSWMKPSALLINTSRGPLIDNEALLNVLEQGKIAGAALDVFDVEPLPLDSPWRSKDWGKNGKSEVLISPHMGYVEEGTVNRWYEDNAMHVEQWLKGEKLETQLT